MTRRKMRIKIVSAVAFLLLIAGLGCATSSHRTVRTYDYSDDPQPARRTSEEVGDDYKMQSPGEMVSPGHMVEDDD